MDNKPVIYEAPKPRPQWGVIILTGLSAALLVILGGLMLGQIGDELDQSDATPAPTATSEWSFLALQIPHEGSWVAIITRTGDSGTPQIVEQRGVGEVPPMITEVTPPARPLPITFRLEINWTAPNLEDGGLLDIPTRSFDVIWQYQQALEKNYYAVYDSNNRFIEVMDSDGLGDLEGVYVDRWQPTPDATEG